MGPTKGSHIQGCDGPTCVTVMGPLGANSRWCNSYRSTTQPLGPQPHCSALPPSFVAVAQRKKITERRGQRWGNSCCTVEDGFPTVGAAPTMLWRESNNKRGKARPSLSQRHQLSWTAVTPENVINGIKQIVSSGLFCHQMGVFILFLDLWKEIGTNQVCMLINSARSSISGSVNDNGWDFYFGNLKWNLAFSSHQCETDGAKGN